MIYAWFAFMILLSGALVAWFLRHPLKDYGFDLQKSNIALGRQKKLELQNDLKLGLIDADLGQQAQDDIAKTLAQELTQSQVRVRENRPVPIWLAAVLAIFIGVFSLLIYQALTPKFTVKIPTKTTQLSLEESAVKLQNYLAEQPENAAAWQILGLKYFELNQLEASLNAYEKAYQLSPKNPKLLVEYASSLAIKNNNDFHGRPIELVKQALMLEPDAPDALYMAGLYAVSEQEFKLAELLWRKALARLKSGSIEHKILLDVLAELSELTNKTDKSVQTVEHLAAGGNSIKVMVDFSDEILSSRAQDFLMIYAKAAVGRPMPLAIVKIRLKDFTGQIILDNSNSLLPNNTLSQAGEVLIVARLSSTGAAFRQAGDIQITSAAVRVKDNPTVNLELK
ncbi:MAG: c-type cytochrome biogenesis protein CcmI [Candidatus Thioglobus sp.]|nr:c-type cytochrome biogenesis protein CcmI [Candidatus Thioglobus sp.]